jgi:hypothetical protein
MTRNTRFPRTDHPAAPRRLLRASARSVSRDLRPVAAFRQRGAQGGLKLEDFNAPEIWHPEADGATTRFVVHPAGSGFRHAATIEEVRDRLALLPAQFTRSLEVVQFSTMTRKRRLFPCYGMQWGTSVYLYPIEASLVEVYRNPPTPQQQIEARMFGGIWSPAGKIWQLTWTEDTIRDFYLNNVLIHEVGHVNDLRNTNSRDRERFANWFAIEYGYRATHTSSPRSTRIRRTS